MPDGVIDRLQDTFRQPDVLGFFFIMGLSIASEPVDYMLTAVDVIDALSKGDKKSAALHFFAGLAPVLKSGMVRGMKQLGRSRLGRLLPTRLGGTLLSRDELRRLKFSDETIEIFEYRGGTGPGAGAKTHEDLLDIRRNNLLEPEGPNAQDGHIIQNENFEILRDQYSYNIISRPNRSQLERIEYYTRTDAGGFPIDSMRKNPDFIIEGRVFDHYAAFAEDTDKALLNIWYTVGGKVPLQTDRLVIDLSNTSLTPERLIAELNKVDFSGQSFFNPGFKDLKEDLIMKNGRYAGIWVNPQY